jgi:hypothetical protein
LQGFGDTAGMTAGMKRSLQIVLCALLAGGSAWLAAEAADGSTGINASNAGGATLGGTGIDSPDPRKEKEADPRVRIEKKPAPPPDQPASTGASSRRSRDLSEEADRQDDEFRKKNRK